MGRVMAAEPPPGNVPVNMREDTPAAIGMTISACLSKLAIWLIAHNRGFPALCGLNPRMSVRISEWRSLHLPLMLFSSPSGESLKGKGALFPLFPQHRSEEHTSELQSP